MVLCIRSVPTLHPVPQVGNGSELVAQLADGEAGPGKHRTRSSSIREARPAATVRSDIEIPSPWGIYRHQALKSQCDRPWLHEGSVSWNPWNPEDTAVSGGEKANKEELPALLEEMEPLLMSEVNASSRSSHMA